MTGTFTSTPITRDELITKLYVWLARQPASARLVEQRIIATGIINMLNKGQNKQAITAYLNKQGLTLGVDVSGVIKEVYEQIKEMG